MFLNWSVWASPWWTLLPSDCEGHFYSNFLAVFWSGYAQRRGLWILYVYFICWAKYSFKRTSWMINYLRSVEGSLSNDYCQNEYKNSQWLLRIWFLGGNRRFSDSLLFRWYDDGLLKPSRPTSGRQSQPWNEKVTAKCGNHWYTLHRFDS